MEDQNIDSSQIVARLLQSFSDLERAIEGAKSNLRQNSKIPGSVHERLESYSSILDRQRELAQVLESYVSAGNLTEVTRHISLINGLSGMIIDDARGLLAGISGQFDLAENDESHFC